jgi:hypothetical protein
MLLASALPQRVFLRPLGSFAVFLTTVAVAGCAQSLEIAEGSGLSGVSGAEGGAGSDDATYAVDDGGSASLDDGVGNVGTDAGPGTDDSAIQGAGDDSGGSDAGTVGSGGGDSGGSAPIDAGQTGSDASMCANDLSNIHTGDFHISVTVQTTQNALTPLVNQRPICAHGVLWDLRVSNGNIRIETEDGVHIVNFTSSGRLVNDGRPHNVLVKRTAGVITIDVDGIAAGTVPSVSSFTRLPPMVSGQDVCIGHAGCVPFVGTITNICIRSP